MRKILLFLAVFLSCLGPAAAADLKLTRVSGDGQTGIEGYPLKEDFVVRMEDDRGESVAGATVNFTIVQPGISGTEQRRAAPRLSAASAVTDADGCARTHLHLGQGHTRDILVSAVTRETVADPVVFRSGAHERYWLPILVLGIIGGLGIFLFGMFYLNDALQKMAGNKLRELLVRLTRSPARGIGTGLFVTFFNQSSSATTLLEVSLVSAGLLTFYQTMAVTMGAEIGSTVTGQLVAFRLAEYAVFIAGLGFFISFFSQSKKWKYIGDALLGFGVLFLGMKIMADLMDPLSSYGPFLQMMKNVENPLYGILAGLVLTLLVHSSGATSAIVIAMALAGVVGILQAITLNLGGMIGTCITAWLGSIGRGREGKRVALWHVTHQTAGVLLTLPFITLVQFRGEPALLYFVQWFTRTFFFTDDPARQIAMAHTIVSVCNALIFFPFLPAISKLLNRIYPAREEEKPFGPIYIDEGFIPTPSLALEQARREIVREGEIVMEMLRDTMTVFESQDLRLSETVSLKDIRVDVLRNAIVPYLTRTGQGMLSDEQSRWETQLLYITADIEAIGDVIDKNIMPLARKRIENQLWFSDEGWKDILDLHARIIDNLRKALDALRSDDRELAHYVADTRVAVNGYESELRKRHISRLHSGLQEALETSSIHLDLIDNLKRINSYTASIGTSLLGKI
jgi:phosphate:Na+ symporter